MIDWNKPVRLITTRTAVKVLSKCASGDYPIIVDHGNGDVSRVTTDGRFDGGSVRYENIPEPEPRFRWLNVWPGTGHTSRAEADSFSRLDADRPRLYVLRLNIDTGETVKWP